jgi:nicotinate phosphoribosyltransferase
MAASYFDLGFNDAACFSMSTRRLPQGRGFLVAAGLERLLDVLAEFHFEQPILDYLDSLKLFSAEFLGFLAKLRFTGEIYALAEGTIFFPQEPIVEVRAPLIEAQLLETLVINQIGMASLIASKAARSVIAAHGRGLVDFGLRRSQGADAGLIAARSSYLTGFIGTSNVLAGMRYGIPIYGTMAHSYIMAHEREREAFEHFVRRFPQVSTLLVDTYDTVRGVENAVRVGLQLRQQGQRLQGIRLDSGDLLDLSLKARRILDQNDLKDVRIFASGNLDEYRICELVKAGAPIDEFGVGTAMVVSADAPALDVAYKLTEYKGTPRMKTSQHKMSLPGCKQVFRALQEDGAFCSDMIGLADENETAVARELTSAPARMTAILHKQFGNGHRVGTHPALAEIREQFLSALAKLPPGYQDLDQPETYPVRYTAKLEALIAQGKVDAQKRQD